MSKEYNLAGKQLVVDGITILGNRKKQRSSILTQAITNGELARDNALTGEQVEALGGTVILISEDLGETKGRVTTNENNISGLDGRMDTAEGNITSQGSRLDTAEGDITSQGNRLTTAEGNISSQGGRITTAEGNISGLQGRMTAAEGGISGLQQVTKRFDVRSRQTSVVRDDTETGFQIINLQSTIIGYDNPQPRLAILASVENFYRICAFDNSPSASTLEDLVEGTSVNPTPSDEGDWYRGGLQFVVGEKAAYVVNDSGEYRTAILTITAVTDTSVTGTIDVGGLLLGTVVGLDDRDMTNVSLYIPFRRAGKIEATLYNGNTQMDKLTIPVSNITRRWKEIPAVDRFGDLPNSETVTEGGISSTKYLIDGDCCVVRYTGSPETFTATTYIYKNNTWVPASEEAQFSDAQQIIQTVYSVVKEAKQYKTDNPSFSYEDLYVGTTGVFEVLKVGLLFAAKIFAEEILSSEWDGLEDGYPKKGFRLSTKEDLIQAVGAVFKGAKIRESDLYDVSISSLDSDSSVLFKTTKTIRAPNNPLAFDNESDGYFVESGIRALSWQAGQNDIVTLSHYSGYRRFVGPTRMRQQLQFTVQHSCNLYIRAPYRNRTIISGQPDYMEMTVYVNGQSIWTSGGSAYNNVIGDLFDFQRGQSVFVDIVLTEHTNYGFTTEVEGSLVVLMSYFDILENKQGGGGATDKGMLIDHYGKSSTISWTDYNTSGTFDFFFPIFEYSDYYVADDLEDADVLVDGASATSKASWTSSVDTYNAVKPFLDAEGTQGGVTVEAIPRGAIINFTQTTVYYKRDAYTVNQLMLTENYVQFMYNEQILFSVNTTERSTFKYSITLLNVDPALTVTDLIPVNGSTDIGRTGNNGAFNNGFINTIKTQSIAPQTGQTLDIQADTISGDLTGDVTGDVTGNVNSAGTPKNVYGAVFN